MNPIPITTPSTSTLSLAQQIRQLFRYTTTDELYPYVITARKYLLRDLPDLHHNAFVIETLEQMTKTDTDSQYWLIFMALLGSPRYQATMALDTRILTRIQDHMNICLMGRAARGERCYTTLDRLHPDFRSFVESCLQLLWCYY